MKDTGSKEYGKITKLVDLEFATQSTVQFRRESTKKIVKDSDKAKTNTKMASPTLANSKTRRKMAMELTHSRMATITKVSGKMTCNMAEGSSTIKITKHDMKVLGVTMRKMVKEC